MSFYSEKLIKAIRKARRCNGCGSMMEVGTPAIKCSGSEYGDFWSADYHRDCRKAEEGINNLHDVRAGDDWMPLSDIDWEDYPWLIEAFPAVAERMKITLERFQRVRDERERVRKAWDEIETKRYEAQRAPM